MTFDAAVLELARRPIPPMLWQSCDPLIAVLPEWRMSWHAYRQLAKHCDLILTDNDGAAAMKSENIQLVRAVALSGIGKNWLGCDQGAGERDIDVLVVGGSGCLTERDQLPLLAHLAAMRSSNWNVRIVPADGEDYRPLASRARILVALNNPAKRAAEAVAAGALFFQDRRTCTGNEVLRDREECVCFDESNLEILLSYYLRAESERLGIIANAKRRLPELTFAVQWDKVWSDLASELPALRERATRRIPEKKSLPVLVRAWLNLACGQKTDPTFDEALVAASKESPRNPHFHNMAGVLALRKSGGNVAACRIDAANAFQDAWHADLRHVVAGMNLCEVLVAMGQTNHTDKQARRTLAMLDRLQPSDLRFL